MFDWMAASGLVLESAFCSMPDLTSSLQQLWATNSQDTLISSTDICSHLITDDQQVAQLGTDSGFSKITPVAYEAAPNAIAEVEDTQFANLIATVIDQLESEQLADITFIHSKGFSGNWDAPTSFRDLYHDDEDPDIEIGVSPPEQISDDPFDEDYLAALQQAYAGQLTMFDSCLSVLLPFLRTKVDRIILTSPRGYNLGRHRRVGINSNQLVEDVVHIPFILLDHTFEENPVRNQWLFSTGSLGQHLHNFVFTDQESPSLAVFQSTGSVSPHIHDAPIQHQVIRMQSDEEIAVRTPAWHARFEKSTCEPTGVYAKPDDRWEANNIADRCGEAFEHLRELASTDSEIQELDKCLVLF